MKIFKYIFKLTLTNTFISILVIIGIVWVSQSFRYIKFILEKGGSLLDFLKLSFLSMPAWLSISISFGVFFGLLISFSKLDNERELVVMKASGLNAYQIAQPGILICIIFSILLFFNLHFLLPFSYSYFKNYENKVRFNSPQYVFNETTFFDFDKNKTIYFKKKINERQIEDIFIQDRSNKNKIIEIFAKNGVFQSDANNIYLIFKNGTKIISDSKNIPTIIDFKLDTIPFKKYKTRDEKEKDIKKTMGRVVELNELNFIELTNKSNLHNKLEGKYLAEAHSRNINALLPLTFGLLVLVTILMSNFSRSNSTSKKIIIYSLIIITQTAVIVIKNLVTTNIIYLTYFYLVPILIISLCFFSLKLEHIIKLTINNLKPNKI